MALCSASRQPARYYPFLLDGLAGGCGGGAGGTDGRSSGRSVTVVPLRLRQAIDCEPVGLRAMVPLCVGEGDVAADPEPSTGAGPARLCKFMRALAAGETPLTGADALGGCSDDGEGGAVRTVSVGAATVSTSGPGALGLGGGGGGGGAKSCLEAPVCNRCAGFPDEGLDFGGGGGGGGGSGAAGAAGGAEAASSCCDAKGGLASGCAAVGLRCLSADLLVGDAVLDMEPSPNAGEVPLARVGDATAMPTAGRGGSSAASGRVSAGVTISS
mmetsp:Transcript_18785/g.43663  ORF Transcript_18785/g.43663 Transcript_18785/m.43663 type:complete len:271 (-) Transcript_18785:5361-6173(-)